MAGRPKIKPLTDAEKAMVAANIYLADWGAGQLSRRYRHSFTYDELRSFCWEGLIRAVKKYDPARAKLSTHAFVHMRSVALRELKRNRIIAVPIGQQADASRTVALADEELTAIQADVRKVLAMHRVPSHPGVRGQGAGSNPATGIYEAASAGDGPDEEASDREAAEILSAELNGELAMLEPREADIVRRCVMERSATLEVVGAEYGICRERTRQIKEEALATLRRRLKKGRTA